MTIDDFCAALAAMVAALPPVAVGETESYTFRAFDPPPPDAPDTADLPAVWVFTRQATYADSDHGTSLTETRQYVLQCAVMPVGQGAPLERELRCRPLLEALRAAVIAHSTYGVPYVRKTTLTGDSGIVVLPDFNGANIGFELRLAVMSELPRQFAPEE